MDKLKQQIQQKLIANIIIDKCKSNEYLIFNESWCTQERIILFATPFFRKLFHIEESASAKNDTGDLVIYSIENKTDYFFVECELFIERVPDRYNEIADALLRIMGIHRAYNAVSIILKRWDLTRSDGDVNKLFEDFDYLIEKTIPRFEQELREKLNLTDN